MFGPKPVLEAPLFGAVIGGLIGGGGTLAGIATVGGMIGAGLGAVAGTLLEKKMTPKMPKVSQEKSTPKESDIPVLPPAPTIPPIPSTPTATPAPPMVPAPSENISPDTPISERPSTPAEASPATPQEVAKGQLERKRKGRMSTILTTPQSRLDQGEEEEKVERLGG